MIKKFLLCAFGLVLGMAPARGDAPDQALLYQKLAVNCVQCHANPETGAPLMGNAEQWEPVLKQDKQQVLKNIYLGKNRMPPLGYCSSCTEQDFIYLTRIMAAQPLNGGQETLTGGW